MLQTGKNIIQKDDPLVKIQVDQLYNSIRRPGHEMETKIRMLKALKTLDKKKYDLLKRELPYFVCGIFNPPFRRLENFGWINRFVVDIDHLTAKSLDPHLLKEKLAADTRIEMIFISPGGDGLKIMFRLSEKCFDYGKYSLFYKIFLREFSGFHNLSQVVDSRTSDVTRACFFSFDPEIYYNPHPEPVVMNSIIDFENPFEVSVAQKEMKEFEDKQNECKADFGSEEAIINGPDDDILAQIRQTLNPNARQKRQKIIYVPEELNSTVEIVRQKMSSLSISTDEVINIHYGKKFRFSLGLKKAEVNLFYGKRGFSVVISPRAGTDKELNNICGDLLKELFYSDDAVSINMDM